jgi:hypothetical protein
VPVCYELSWLKDHEAGLTETQVDRPVGRGSEGAVLREPQLQMRLPPSGFLRQGQRRQPRPISVRLKERLNTQEAESRKREEKVRQEGATAVEAARLEHQSV